MQSLGMCKLDIITTVFLSWELIRRAIHCGREKIDARVTWNDAPAIHHRPQLHSTHMPTVCVLVLFVFNYMVITASKIKEQEVFFTFCNSYKNTIIIINIIHNRICQRRHTIVIL